MLVDIGLYYEDLWSGWYGILVTYTFPIFSVQLKHGLPSPQRAVKMTSFSARMLDFFRNPWRTEKPAVQQNARCNVGWRILPVVLVWFLNVLDIVSCDHNLTCLRFVWFFINGSVKGKSRIVHRQLVSMLEDGHKLIYCSVHLRWGYLSMKHRKKKPSKVFQDFSPCAPPFYKFLYVWIVLDRPT